MVCREGRDAEGSTQQVIVSVSFVLPEVLSGTHQALTSDDLSLFMILTHFTRFFVNSSYPVTFILGPPLALG